MQSKALIPHVTPKQFSRVLLNLHLKNTVALSQNVIFPTKQKIGRVVFSKTEFESFLAFLGGCSNVAVVTPVEGDPHRYLYEYLTLIGGTMYIFQK